MKKYEDVVLIQGYKCAEFDVDRWILSYSK